MDQKFYICKKCGNIIAKIKDTGCAVSCCGEPMPELIAGTTEAAAEKHIPVVSREGSRVTVSVGSVHHPMIDKHYIEWVSLQTKKGNQLNYLDPGETPKTEFIIPEGDDVEAVYAYCNLHSLWKC